MKIIFKFITLLLFFASAALCQTAPVVQNPSFEIASPLSNSCGSGCSWNSGSIPLWAASPGTVNTGSFHPSSTYFDLPLPDGNNVIWIQSGSVSQTLSGSLLPNTVYTLTVYVGHRKDGYTCNYTVSLLAGSTLLSSVTGPSILIPAGSFAPVTTTYTSQAVPPSGNLAITLASDGLLSTFDDVTLTAAPNGPLIIPYGGMNFTFPISSLSQLPLPCSPADGVCSMAIQVCDTAAPPNCLMATSGVLSIVKIITLPVPQTQTVPLVVASP